MKIVNVILRKLGFEIVRANDPARDFHSNHYLRHNARRLEHLASLRIPVAGLSVLEVGAGIGDHSHYYIDRGCSVTITDARAENLRYLKGRYPNMDVQFLDMEHPISVKGSPFDVVHCYGLLYHVSTPLQALAFLARSTRYLLFLETCVSFGEEEDTHPVAEMQISVTQAYSGTGCRPTRPWLYRQLTNLFEYVYVPKTQPNHEQFPLEWKAPRVQPADSLQRAIFVASRTKLDNELLVQSMIDTQVRHE